MFWPKRSFIPFISDWLKLSALREKTWLMSNVEFGVAMLLLCSKFSSEIAFKELSIIS